MTNKLEKPFGVVIAGVGGQGVITMTQIILGAAWRAGLHALQSEIHGMSQRDGEVTAQVVIDSEPVTSPIVEDSSADVLIGLEPLEAQRAMYLMAKDSYCVTSNNPLKNMQTYPDEELLLKELSAMENVSLFDTKQIAKELKNKHAGNIVLLGLASKKIPIAQSVWHQVFEELFSRKGENVVQMNIDAFEYGRNL